MNRPQFCVHSIYVDSTYRLDLYVRLDMFIVITVPNKARLYVVDQRYTVKRRVGLAGKRGNETSAALCRK